MTEQPLVRVDRDAPEPPFEQVRTQLAGAVARGEMPPGTRLPSVRALAEELGLAVNTVARVYKELEADGVVETRGRHGTVVRSGPELHGTDVTDAAARFVATCRGHGVTRSEALRLLEDSWHA